MRLVENAIVAGRFRLNHLLQRGGMGSVWHATHLGLDIPCALKFVKGELLENEDVVSRFEREAKAAAQLRSPNVVQILDHGVFDGTPYMAMELLDGEDLGERLRKVGRLTPESLHHIMTGVCRALYKAHSQGIVHRDLKPGNIFLVRDDDQEIPKVLDFGIAKSMTDVVGGGTKTGAMLGTPYYMSPEQAQGTKQVDFRSDLWSLAVICFQSLTGKLPFQSEALGDLLVKIIVSPIPSPSQMGPVPPGFDQWWLKAASRDAAERFQSAKEFSDTLAIVCGISQISSVIDRSQLHVEALGAVAAAPPAEPPLSAGATIARPLSPAARQPAPPMSTQAPATAPRPPPMMPAAPPPPMSATAASPAPQPVPPMAPVPLGAANGPGPATPAPLSRSTVEDPTVPVPKGTPVLTYIAAGLALMTVCLMVGWYAFRGKAADVSSKTTAAASAAATPTATTAATATATAPPAPTETVPPPATAAAGTNPGGWPSSADGTQAAPRPSASTETAAAPSPAPTPAKETTASNSGSSSSSSSESSSGSHTHGSGKHGTAPKPAAPSSPKQPVDMGF